MIKKILIWILFIPISVLATIVATKVFYYLNKLTDLINGFDSNGLLYRLYTPIIYGIITGLVFVYVGAFIVPKFKKFISLFLAFVISAFFITSYFTGGFDDISLAWLQTIVVVISSFFTAFRFFHIDESLND